MEDKIIIIFVYLGVKLPTFAYYSLNFTRQQGNEVILLTDAKYNLLKLGGIEVVEISDFYIRSGFFEEYLLSQIKFRNGFYIKTFERFFVLQQYAILHGISKFFHAEIDNIVFDLENLSERLDSLGDGIFLPLIDRFNFIASLVYVNNIDKLNRFLEFSYKSNKFQTNDMQMFAEYANTYQGHIIILPSTIQVNPENVLERCPLTVKDIGGIVDASIIGHYMLGVDPRNKIGPVFNMFINKLNYYFNLSDYELHITHLNDKLSLSLARSNSNYKIYNIHIHSKRTIFFENNKKLNLLINRLNIKKQSIISLNLSSLLNYNLIFYYMIRIRNLLFKKNYS